MKKTPKEHWSGKTGFMLAAIGSAIGLGNIWRFPYIVGESGGGAFLIPYIICVLFFAIPVMLMEIAVGRRFKTSPLSSLGSISRKSRLLGIVAVITCVGILSYYLVVMGWTLSYFAMSVFSFADFSEFASGWGSVAGFIISLGLTAYLVSIGVKEGIEKVCRILMPILGVIMIFLAFQSLSMPGASDGIEFYLSPDISKLASPDTWIMAMGQAFFSLSAGTAILLTYGSYLGRKQNIVSSVAGIAVADTLIAFVAGIIVFPVVFSFGTDPASGVKLAFVTLPQIFSAMPMGSIFGAFFFAALSIAALTSAISMLEVPVSTSEGIFKVGRKKAVAISSGLIFLLGLPSALSYSSLKLSLFGMPVLDAMDIFFNSRMIPLSAIALCIGIAWLWNPEKLLREINRNSGIKPGRTAVFLMRFVIPAGLVVLLLSSAIV